MYETFFLSPDASKSLRNSALSISTNPYLDYSAFKAEVSKCLPIVHNEFKLICEEILFKRVENLTKAFFIRNLPIGEVVSMGINETKDAFVGEFLLEALSILTDTPTLAYNTRNNGDFFQEVSYQSKYPDTQTQKTDGELSYHNDRTAHPVRPDYLALLGVKVCSSNLIYTGFVDASEILSGLSSKVLTILAQPFFETPYDDLSRDSNPEHIKSKPHAIFYDFDKLCYHDGRTVPLNNASSDVYDAYIAFRNALLFCKKSRVQILEGDLFTFPNQSGLHNREIVEIKEPFLVKKRKLLKTYNFRNSSYMDIMKPCFIDDCPGLVNDFITQDIFELEGVK